MKVLALGLTAALAVAQAHDPHVERQELKRERRMGSKERDLERKQKRQDKRRQWY